MPKSTVNTGFNPTGGGNLSEIKDSSLIKCLKTFANRCFIPIKRKLKNPCHSEFISESDQHEVCFESQRPQMLKQVQHDMESYRNIHKTPCHPEFSSGSDQREIIQESGKHEIFVESIKPKIPKQVRNDMKTNVKYASVAFTLAETLITIGMIGVIAALTLPTLMNSTNEKEIVARVKKVYATLNEAYGRAYAKYGSSTSWCSNLPAGVACNRRIMTRITEFLQVEKDCQTGKGCFADATLNAIDTNASASENLSRNIDSMTGYQKCILSDGTSLAFSSAVSANSAGVSGYALWIDIDGPKKGKNLMGSDIFLCYVYKDIDRIGALENISNNTASLCRAGNPNHCLVWILNSDNADYINCAGLTDSNPTCN